MSEQELVLSVEGYAITLAKRMHHKDHPLFDLNDVIQAARLGAVKAAHTYEDDHESGANFLTYAVWKMKNEILNLYQSSTGAHVPRREYEDMTSEQRGHVVWGDRVYMSVPIHRDSDVSDCLGDIIPAESPETQCPFTARQVHWMISKLGYNERRVIKAVFGFYGAPISLSALARRRGVSRQAENLYLQRALARMKRMAQARKLNAR